jgi:hypothetical protein
MNPLEELLGDEDSLLIGFEKQNFDWWRSNPGLVENHSAGKILKSMNAEWERLQKRAFEEN